MAHFAKLDSNNQVLEVHVVNNNELLDSSGNESEAMGIAFLTIWSGGYTNWRQTSYNSSFRKHYAGIGYTYDPQLDAFIPPKPYPSWILDETTCRWISPVPYPQDDKIYQWNESTISWDLFNSIT
jgi:hypothetical protein